MLNLLQAEIIKQRRMNFVRVVTVAPLAGVGILAAIYLVLKIGGSRFGGIPSQVQSTTGLSLGGGLVALSSSLILVGLSGLFTIALVLIAGQIINNEYTWSTIKMVATREPSRPRIVLAKGLFLLVYTLLMFVVFIIAWLLLSFVFKLAYGDSLLLNSADTDALNKGFAYAWPGFLGSLVWSMLSLALALRLKSVVGAFILYFIYSIIDNLGSTLGIAALHGQLHGLPEWLSPVVEGLKLICPFLINTNLARLTQPATPPDNFTISTYLETVSPVQAVLVLIGWGALFIGLAILSFNRRDITE